MTSGLAAARRAISVVGLVLASLGAMCWHTSASAEPSVPPPPVFSSVDERGVSLVDGVYQTNGPTISIGIPGAGGLSFTPLFSTRAGPTGGPAWTDNYVGTISSETVAGLNVYTVVMMGASTKFEATGTFPALTFNRTQGLGSLTLSHDSGTGITTYTYTTQDGTEASYSSDFACSYPARANVAVITQIKRPNNEILTFTQERIGPIGTCIHRLMSVTNNFGYQIKFEYPNSNTFTYSRVTALNNGIEWCNPTANSCAITGAWPQLTFGASSITDAAGRVTSYQYDSVGITGIRWPGSAVNNVTIGYDFASKRVTSWTDGVGTWTYGYTGSGGTGSTTINGPLSFQRTVAYTNGQVSADTDSLGRTTTYLYGTWGLTQSVKSPQGNTPGWTGGYTQFAYDSRGNLTTTTRTGAVPVGNTPPTIVTSATYPASCNSPYTIRNCNSPLTSTDANNNVTTYSFSPVHGGLLAVTGPSVNGVRAEVRNTYEQKTAWYRASNSGNQNPIADINRPWLLTQVSSCANGEAPACLNSADETRTATTYEAGSASVRSNLVPTQTSTGPANGDSTNTAITALSYDSGGVGNVVAVNGPLSGTTDTIYFRYDVLRRQNAAIAPDPDGTPDSFPATYVQFHSYGGPSSLRRGVVPSSSSDPATMTPLAEQTRAYDVQTGQLLRMNELLGGAIQAIQQMSYDQRGRAECVTVRMNSAVFGSLPVSACDQSTGDLDRIFKNTYDAADQLVAVSAAYDTSNAHVQRAIAYTRNGLVDWSEDANGNRSAYIYDAFDRVCRLYFPYQAIAAHTANSGTAATPLTCSSPSNVGDFEGYAYDAASNLTSVRRRSGDADSITFQYDALNRRTRLNLPGGDAGDVFYSYDNFGRPLSARFASVSGDGIIFSYPSPLQVTETDTIPATDRTVTSTLDLAGRRTALTYPGGLVITYSYDLLNRIDQVKNGATVLADYSYDALSRVSGVTRSGGPTSTYTYNPTSFSWTYAHDFSDNAYDINMAFSRNPAGQTVNRTPTPLTGVYTYAPPSTGVSAFARDGLNRYSSVGSASLSYDARGNLTSDGSRSFSYDLLNRLVSVSGSATLNLTYDPLGRLRQTTAGTTTQLAYDGDQLIAEYNGATILRQYVHASDMPLVWYEGTSTTDRRYYTADELGSITANTSSGTPTAYAYGAYGQPTSWSGSRFRYTGQIMLSEASLYHYRSRVYDPTLGRFLQTDPIGYSGGANLYSYAGNDPVNGIDPTGTTTIVVRPPPYWRDDNGGIHWNCAQGGCNIPIEPDGGLIKIQLGGVAGDVAGGAASDAIPGPRQCPATSPDSGEAQSNDLGPEIAGAVGAVVGTGVGAFGGKSPTAARGGSVLGAFAGVALYHLPGDIAHFAQEQAGNARRALEDFGNSIDQGTVGIDVMSGVHSDPLPVTVRCLD